MDRDGAALVQLPNRSQSPEEAFATDPADVPRDRLLRWQMEHPEGELILWHTHPRGQVGPSRTDMKSRVAGIRHLVISLDGDKILPTWY